MSETKNPRVEELLGLNTGEVYYRENISAFDLIIAERMVILTSPRGTFLHYQGSPEYNLFLSLYRKENEVSELTDEEFDNFREMLLITPMVYFFMFENVDFHSRTVFQYLGMLNELMEQAVKDIDEDPEKVNQYLNEQQVLDAVMTLMRGNAKEVKAKTRKRK